MNIVIDARLYGTEFTGLGRYTMNLVDELAILDKKNNYSVLLRRNYYRKLKLPTNFKKIEVDIPIYTMEEQLKLPPLLNKMQVDFVHFPHLNVPVFYNKKFLVTIHDIIMQKQGKDASTLPFPVYYLKRFPFKFVASNAVKNSLKIFCPSNTVKHEIIDFYGVSEEKIEVTYEGVNERTSYKGKRKQSHGRYFFYVGNAYPHKNLEFLIRSINHLNDKLEEDVQLFIRTDKNEFRNRLERYAEKIGASNHVKFINRVDDEELGELYKSSIAFIFPSLTEGFGLPGLEAIQNDTLLLAADTSIFREVYKDKAIYFDPYDVEDLVSKMNQVVKMKTETRNRKINESKQLLKNYSWKNMAKETLKVYESI